MHFQAKKMQRLGPLGYDLPKLKLLVKRYRFAMHDPTRVIENVSYSEPDANGWRDVSVILVTTISGRVY